MPDPFCFSCNELTSVGESVGFKIWSIINKWIIEMKNGEEEINDNQKLEWIS